MTDEEFAQILALGHETRGTEFKGPGPLSNRRLAAQVVRAVLGMTNRRDGGRVIIGVEDNGGVINPVGLSASDLATWNYDDVATRIAAYADPAVEFDLEIKEYNRNQYVIIHVEEFADVPILCKRSYDDVLREGACYVRSRRKPETSEIPTIADMRDLLDLAIDKGVAHYLDRARRIGLIIPPTVAPSATDQELFDQQRGDLNE
jgi:predicted HTH transcriptional regulator